MHVIAAAYDHPRSYPGQSLSDDVCKQATLRAIWAVDIIPKRTWVGGSSFLIKSKVKAPGSCEACAYLLTHVSTRFRNSSSDDGLKGVSFFTKSKVKPNLVTPRGSCEASIGEGEACVYLSTRFLNSSSGVGLKREIAALATVIVERTTKRPLKLNIVCVLCTTVLWPNLPRACTLYVRCARREFRNFGTAEPIPQ